MSQLHTSASRASRRTVPFLLLALMTLQFSVAAPRAQAAPAPNPQRANRINLAPTITGITIQGNQLFASGFVTATINGTTTTAPFTGIPLGIGLAPNQLPGAACPVLDLTLGPINLNLLGLVVQTSPICLTITAYQGGGLLGNLLCAVANLLDDGLTLGDILDGNLPGLTGPQITQLTNGLTALLNQALRNLLLARLTQILPGGAGACAILHLELGPLTLNLLGLVVELDNCANGPVVVDITAQPGALLGDLLCQLLDGGLVSGLNLQAIINRILALLN